MPHFRLPFQLVFALFLIDFLDISLCDSTSPLCRKAEREALLKLKHNINQFNVSGLSTWAGAECCEWDGVYCSETTGNIVELDLSDKLISGVAMDGEVLLPLLSLDHLLALDVSINSFNGSKIPKFIGSFKSLTDLDISGCNFRGSIPDEFGNLSALQYFVCVDNEVSVENVGWLSKLKSLRTLGLSNVNMGNAFGWLEALNTLPVVEEIYLDYCELNSLPPISHVNFTRLSALSLMNNNITSVVPHWLFNLHTLTDLYLDDNQFYGSFPTTISNFSSLEYLSFSLNQMTGTIPPNFAQLRNLVALNMRGNSFNGSLFEHHFTNMSRLRILDTSANNLIFKPSNNWIPPFQLDILRLDFCQVGPEFPIWIKTQNHSLSYLGLTNAGISDAIPSWLSDISKLVFISLSDNWLSGPIPFKKPLLNLTFVDLSYNNLSGNITPYFCELENLEFLDISGNNVSGELPNCWRISASISYIISSHTNLHGEIPVSLCTLRNLQYLQLNHNNIFSNVPSCLLNHSTLVTLDLSHNKLTGSIPSLLGENGQPLVILNLESNFLSGTIPELSHLAYLQILDLSNNNLSGTIPSSIGRLQAMTALRRMDEPDPIYYPFMGYYTLSFITKGIEREYIYDSLRIMTLIDLSSNGLVGYIPNELMNLHGLEMLNLSGNGLTGEIPRDIDGLRQIEILDLSRNHLSGEIPLSLQSLYFLDNLNLSYNDLSGPIPTGNQLGTLNDPSIYEGNAGLCGFPIKKNCTISEQNGGHGDDNEDAMHEEFIWLYVAIAPGFVTGFWAFCGTLILKRKWRIAYFHAVDIVYNVLHR